MSELELKIIKDTGVIIFFISDLMFNVYDLYQITKICKLFCRKLKI